MEKTFFFMFYTSTKKLQFLFMKNESLYCKSHIYNGTTRWVTLLYKIGGPENDRLEYFWL